MNTRIKSVACAGALIVSTALITTKVVSQPDQAQPDPEQMMAEWMKLAEPGPVHKEMAHWVGTWHQDMTHWMMPGTEPTKSTAKAVNQAVLGGRFIIEHTKGKMEFGGEARDFEGMGIFGYDNIKQKHVYAWIDNFGTLLMTGEGEADATGKTITYYSEMPDPSGMTMKIKTETHVISKDKHVMKMFMQMPDGTWFQNMQIDQTRVAGGGGGGGHGH